MMQKVRCYECGRQYDYDEDGFCPRCGAFNQPPGETLVSADGTVVRADGLNERNHTDSFVHRELHAEKRQRRSTGLDKSVERIQRKAPAADRSAGKRKGKLENPFFWVIFAIILLNFLSAFLRALF